MFREKALARRARRETVDARLQVTAPHEWLLVSGLGVALVLLLAYGLLGRVERSLSIETVLVRPGERIDVVAGVSGVVVDVLSEVGDTVTPGQPIARVRTPEAERWGAVLRRLRESMESAGGSSSSVIVPVAVDAAPRTAFTGLESSSATVSSSSSTPSPLTVTDTDLLVSPGANTTLPATEPA